MPNKQVTFPELLRTYRKNRKLSQAELGKKVGVSQSMVALYENGKNLPTTKEYKTFADLFEMNVIDFVNLLYPANDMNEYERFLIELDMDTPFEELKKTHQLMLDGVALTDEEYKEAIELIRFNRFKKSRTMNNNLVPFNQKD